MKRVHVNGNQFGRAQAAALVFALLCAACEAEKPKVEAPVATATAPAAASTGEAKPKAPEKPTRPEKIDTAVSAERKAAIESAYPEAKGFLVGTELEETLKKNKALKDKGAALKAFDKQAQGKWVLFTGPIVNLTDTGFDLGVTFTPRMENDPMGMSRQFFMVTLSGVEGYEKAAFKDGQTVVALVKYEGNAKASKGYELVAKNQWK